MKRFRFLLAIALTGAIAAMNFFDQPEAQAYRRHFRSHRGYSSGRLYRAPRRFQHIARRSQYRQRDYIPVSFNPGRDDDPRGSGRVSRDGSPVPVSQPAPPTAPVARRINPAWRQDSVGGEVVSQSGMLTPRQVIHLSYLAPQNEGTMRGVVPQAPYKQTIDPTGKYFIDWYRAPANSSLKGKPVTNLLVGLSYDWQAKKYVNFGIGTDQP